MKVPTPRARPVQKHPESVSCEECQIDATEFDHTAFGKEERENREKWGPVQGCVGAPGPCYGTAEENGTANDANNPE